MPKRKYTAEALDREAARPKEPETIVISSDEEEPAPKVRGSGLPGRLCLPCHSQRSRREEKYRARTSLMDVDPVPAPPEDERIILVEDNRWNDSEVDYEYAHDALNLYRRANVSSETPVL